MLRAYRYTRCLQDPILYVTVSMMGTFMRQAKTAHLGLTSRPSHDQTRQVVDGN